MTADDLHRALAIVDLTRLERPDDAAAIDALAAKAVTPAGSVAALCVYPEWIGRALGPGVPVAAVANFPAGADDPALAAREAAGAVEAGAAEVDVVVPWRAFLAGDTEAIERVVSATRAAIGDGVGLKAILETGSLGAPEAIRAAGERALGAGADFLKTSTGKVGPGASLEAARALLLVVRAAGHGGVKASGGIRTADQAAAYLALADELMGSGWATAERFRIGASALVDDLHARLANAAAAAAAAARSVLPQELIRRKRDGGELETHEIEWLVRGIADGWVSDAQVGALAMAVVLRGMTRAERVALTGAMMRSGEVLDWSEADLSGPVLDKHSTGGVGDKVSLLLAPIVAACGGAVPMISGRGLGHTGGTLDKLESIPGYVTTPDPGRLRSVVRDTGCAIVGQTAALVPADRRLYAIRDATATVESLPLIVASILSKKLAAGLDALVMDVKVGSGAFMPDMERARELGQAIVDVAAGNALPASALVTDMDQVLGRTAGNALEVREAIDHLTGAAADPRLLEVTLALSRELLALGGIDGADPDAALRSGAAAERFAAMTTALGGPADLVEDPDAHLPVAPHVVAALPDENGVVTAIDVRAVGLAVVALGGGRAHEAQGVDHAVGLSEVAAPGERVGPAERPLALVHARTEAAAHEAVAALRAAYAVGDAPPPEAPAVRERLGAS